MRNLLLAVGLLVFTLAGAPDPRPVFAGDSDVLEDPDYRFRIRRPAADWRLLGEEDARSVVPDAIAGLTDLRGAYFMVIVEEVGDQGLDGLAGVLRENVQGALEGAELGELETLTFQGMPARRWASQGRIQGVAIRYQHLVALRGRFAYQLVGWSPDGAGPGESGAGLLASLAEGFTFTEGEVRGRALKQKKHAVQGVGWRLKEGVYQDAVNGIEWTPPSGWRLAVGQELRGMNDSACVGLICSDPEAYVIVISEAARGVDPADLARNLRAGLAASGTPVGAAAPLVVGGRSFSMQGFRIASQLPIRLHHGVRVDAGRAVQVQWWAVEGVLERARPRVLEALRALRFLDAASTAALAADIRAARDPQEHVGPGHGLRAGVYRDFEHGFTWTKPAGFWVVTAGQDARARNKDATIYLEEASHGLQGMVIVETIADVEARALHDMLVERLEPKDKVLEPTTIELEGASALSTEVRPGTLAMPFRYVVTSVVRGERAYQLLHWGLEGNVEAARAQLAAAIRGFAFSDALTAVERTDAAFVDHRLGFRLKHPAGPGWRLGQLTPPNLRAIGTLVAYSKGDALVMGGAFCAMAEEQDDRLLRDLALQAMRRQAAPEAAEPTESSATVAGLPARRLEMGGEHPMIAWVFGRGRTFYLLLVGAPAKLGVPEAEIPALIELFD